MTEDQERAVAQIKKIMPHMGYRERLEWIDMVADWFPSREDALIELTSKSTSQMAS